MKRILILICAAVLAVCCTPKAQEGAHTDWSYNSVVYEMNVRQLTPEGTFAAAAEQLPRLRELGVDIVWLMPIHPIGVLERKGTLGSYYAPRDYREVNPEFGTLEDFDAFVSKAHSLGLKVILDWVAITRLPTPYGHRSIPSGSAGTGTATLWCSTTGPTSLPWTSQKKT